VYQKFNEKLIDTEGQYMKLVLHDTPDSYTKALAKDRVAAQCYGLIFQPPKQTATGEVRECIEVGDVTHVYGVLEAITST